MSEETFKIRHCLRAVLKTDELKVSLPRELIKPLPTLHSGYELILSYTRVHSRYSCLDIHVSGGNLDKRLLY